MLLKQWCEVVHLSVKRYPAVSGSIVVADFGWGVILRTHRFARLVKGSAAGLTDLAQRGSIFGVAMSTRSFGLWNLERKWDRNLDKMAAERETDDGELLLQRLSQNIKDVSLKILNLHLI